MFYVKTKINDETTIRTEITYENVFTVCPKCNKEHHTDLVGIIANGGDLHTTTEYCAECSAEIIQNNAKK